MLKGNRKGSRVQVPGGRRFGNFTRDNVGRPFAIVLDDKVLSAPVMREPILGGTGQISGSFTVESANTLAVQLRSGALLVIRPSSVSLRPSWRMVR